MLRQSSLKFLPKTISIKLLNKTMDTIEFDYKLFFDGASKGNPGLAGAGAVIYHYEKEIWNGYKFIGEKATNNEAEYSGLIIGLNKAIELNIKSLLVNGDSLLVINQMSGKYKCNSENLLPLYNTAKELSAKFKNIQFQHIYRNLNKRADELSNIAITNFQINELTNDK
jgi:ribonuclease HI